MTQIRSYPGCAFGQTRERDRHGRGRRPLCVWLIDGRAVLVTAQSGPALFPGAWGRRLDVRQARTVVHQTVAAVDSAPGMGRHGMRVGVAVAGGA